MNNQGEKSKPNIKTNEERLSLLKSRLKIAKTFCKKVHNAWKSYIREYNIEDVDDTGEIRDKVRIGYIFRKTESEIPAIFDDQPDLFIKGRSLKVKQIEPLIDGAYDFLWDTQNLEEKIEDVGVYFELLGMGFIKSPWVTKTKKVQETVQSPVIDPLTQQPALDPVTQQPLTQPMIQVYDVPVIDQPMASVPNPFKLYFSPETVFGPRLDYEHCPYYFEEIVMTKEAVKAKFGKDVEANESLKIDDDETDTEAEKDASTSEIVKDDMKRVTVYEYYGCLPEDMAKDVVDAQGNKVEWSYDKDYHLYLTKNEELLIEESEDDYKNLFPVGNYGLANKFFKFGDAKHLRPLVQELEMYRSHILQHTRKMANPKPLVPTTANVDEDAFRDPRVGRMVKYQGQQKPEYLSPAPLGQEVSVGVEMVRTDLEKTAGTFDLANGGNQSTVKTPRGIQVYSEAADKNVRRKRKKIARLIRELIIFQFKQIAKNWKPEDAKTIDVLTDGDEQPIQVTQEVLDVLGTPQILQKLNIEVESLSVNRSQMKQDALDLWDTVKDRPDIFNIRESAKDLLQNGFGKKDADRYLLSEQQQQQMIIENFIKQIGQANPTLAGALSQYLTNPALQQFNQTSNNPLEQNANTQPNPQPPV